jgi:hypothetical protein
VVGIAHGTKLCPVDALRAWLSAAGITSGPIFRSVNRHGQVGADALTPQTVALGGEALRPPRPGWMRRSMPGIRSAPGW